MSVFDDNKIYFFLFLTKTYVVSPHLNRLIKTVQMRGHNICFKAKCTKIISNYHQILPLIWRFELYMRKSMALEAGKKLCRMDGRMDDLLVNMLSNNISIITE